MAIKEIVAYPGSGNMKIGSDDAHMVSSSIADVLCWFAGYEAAGGSKGPINLEPLRDLKREMDRLYRITPTAAET